MSVWLTYAQAGERLGISAEAARQIAMRRKWPRRRLNDAPNGQVQVLVPDDAEARPRTTVEHLFDASSTTVEPPADARPIHVQHPSEAVTLLAAQLEVERRRVDQAEARAERAEQRAERAEDRAAAAEQGREAERIRAETERLGRDAERARAEAAETTATGLRTRLDALDQAEAERAAWPLWRRLRWAMRRR